MLFLLFCAALFVPFFVLACCCGLYHALRVWFFVYEWILFFLYWLFGQWYASIGEEVAVVGREIGDAGVASIARGVIRNKKCKNLTLMRVGMTDASQHALLEVLRRSKSLQELHFAGNHEAGVSLEQVADAAMEERRIRVLELSFTSLRKERVFRSLLRHKSVLRCLVCAWSPFGDADYIALAEALRCEDVLLEELDLRGSDMASEAGLEEIAHALRHNKHLKVLNLWKTELGPRAGQALGMMLRENSTLQTLDCSMNRRLAGGCVAIFESLKENSTLTNLQLHGCSFAPSCVISMADMLRCNSTLRVLSAHFLHLEFHALVEALKENKSLACLDLAPLPQRREWHDLLHENGTLIDCSVLKELCARNRKMHLKAKRVAMALLMIRARKNERCILHGMPKEIVQIIARKVWESKTEIRVWGE